MGKPLTQHGVDDFQALLDKFNSVGEEILTGEKSDHVRPVRKKIPRKFKMKEACEMIGRSDASLRKLEQSDTSFIPEKLNGIRYYSLELINRIRDKVGTRYKRPESSDPIILAIANYKGGVGKSTTTNSLACKMALSGLRVLSIGLDGQGTDALFYGFIPDLDVKECETIGPALLDDPALIKSVIRKTFFDGIDSIPGNLGLAGVEMSLTNHEAQMKKMRTLGFPDERLTNALAFVKNDYDVIVLDCAPNSNVITYNAINACNALIAPIPPALPDLASFCSFCKSLSTYLATVKRNKSLEYFSIVMTKHPKDKTSNLLEDLIYKSFAPYAMNKSIVNSSEIGKAATLFSSLYEQPKSAAKTYKRAMLSLDSVFDEVLTCFKEIWDAQSKKDSEESK